MPDPAVRLAGWLAEGAEHVGVECFVCVAALLWRVTECEVRDRELLDTKVRVLRQLIDQLLCTADQRAVRHDMRFERGPGSGSSNP